METLPTQEPTKNERKRARTLLIVSMIVMVLGWILGAVFILDSVFPNLLNPLVSFIDSFGHWSKVIFSLIFTGTVSLLFFIGGIGSSFIYLANILFPDNMTAFLLSTLCIFSASLIQYWLGRKFGMKTFRWAIGEKTYEKVSKITGSPTLIALALLLPYFPDSIVCFFAGTSKMKFVTFALIAFVMRSVGVAGICFFGSGVLSVETWRPAFEAIGTIPTLMLIFSALVSFLVFIVAVLLGGRWLEKKLSERNKKSNKNL